MVYCFADTAKSNTYNHFKNVSSLLVTVLSRLNETNLAMPYSYTEVVNERYVSQQEYPHLELILFVFQKI